MEYKYFASIPNEGEYMRINMLSSIERRREEDELIQKIIDADDKEEKRVLLERLEFYLK